MKELAESAMTPGAAYAPATSREDSQVSFSYIISIVSWNVEGLTKLKIEEVCSYMRLRRVGIVCLQETRKSNSDYCWTDGGFLVLFSGNSEMKRDWAGVGFIVPP